MLDIGDIRIVINLWDPIGLLKLHAPVDEYEPEIKAIWTKCSQTDISISQLGQVVYNTFLDFFDRDVFTCSKRECKKIAEKIMSTKTS